MPRPEVMDTEEVAASTVAEVEVAESRTKPARNIFQLQKEDEPTPVEAKPAETPKPEAAAPPKKKFVREYQTVDGRTTHLEADTAEELIEKMETAHKKAVEGLHLWRSRYKATLEEGAEESLPTPASLSAEDQARIVRKMNNPATIQEGFAELHKAITGESPEETRNRVKKEAERVSVESAKSETEKFKQMHPDFPIGPAAKDAMIARMQHHSEKNIEAGKKPLAWTAHNLSIIYEDLVSEGVIVPNQISQEPAKAAAPVATPTPAANPEGQETARIRPRGTRHTNLRPGSGATPTNATQKQADAEFLQGVQKLSKHELRERLKDPKFRARLDNAKW